ncbi:hypothetical protein, partial [Rhodococcus jostii]|uniref:hypothetical protein n=1 Tax=Rhodococcus jostii TaxID=132919 RepID=UPI0036291EF0
MYLLVRSTSVPIADRVGPGRGAGVAPGPFPRPALRTGRATHRIRRSTDCHCQAGTEVPMLVHGVGMLLARH